MEPVNEVISEQQQNQRRNKTETEATSIAKRLKSLEAWKAKKLGAKKSPLPVESENTQNKSECGTESAAKILDDKAKKFRSNTLGQNHQLPLLRDIITHDRYVPVTNSVKQLSQSDVDRVDTSTQATVDSGCCHQISYIPETTKDIVQVIPSLAIKAELCNTDSYDLADTEDSSAKTDTPTKMLKKKSTRNNIKLDERSDMGKLADQIIPQLNDMQKNLLGLLFFNDLSSNIVEDMVTQQLSMMPSQQLASAIQSLELKVRISPYSLDVS